MCCGQPSCMGQYYFEPEDDASACGRSNVNFIQTAPVDFTREELKRLRDRAQDLLPWATTAKLDLLEDLAVTLDLLDAVAAREELDLRDTEVATVLLPMYPRPDNWEHVTHRAPRCGPDCTLIFGIEELD